MNSVYLKWNEKIISNFSDENINSLYNQGYLFGRTEKGALFQTRSLRIDLSTFELSSENRRILRKTENVILEKLSLPYQKYHWSIGKLAKDFYDTKFGEGTFSANKIKELMTEPKKSNFNTLLIYSLASGVIPAQAGIQLPENTIGYCISLETNELFHYCYPFYSLDTTLPNLGLGMMLKAVMHAKEQDKKYVYLGSAQRPTDTYKLQFAGLEWFDGKEWKTDHEELKNLLNSLGGSGATAV